MNLDDVHRGVHQNKSRKRLGRGPGSGQGKTAGRGHKGQRPRRLLDARDFEGGQMPLVRRVPKRGFHNRFALIVAVVNLDDLEKRFASGEEVNPETLREEPREGQVRPPQGARRGRADQGPQGTAHRFSQSAREKIEKAGGQVVVLPGKAPVVKQKKQKTEK